MTARATLTQRVDLLEQNAGDLGELRVEVRRELAAVRADVRAVEESLRADLKERFESLLTEIREGDEETRRYMRVLHEDLVVRIATINEGR